VELLFSKRLPIPSDVTTLESLAEIAFHENLTAFKALQDEASDVYKWSELNRVNNFVCFMKLLQLQKKKEIQTIVYLFCYCY
jgi:hypothetical protein